VKHLDDFHNHMGGKLIHCILGEILTGSLLHYQLLFIYSTNWNTVQSNKLNSWF